MRFITLLLSLFALTLVAADPAQIKPTVVDRIQAFIDPTTGQIERLEIYDANELVDSAGNAYKTPLRVTVVKRDQAPAIFTALNNLVSRVEERNEAHRARKAAESAVVPKEGP